MSADGPSEHPVHADTQGVRWVADVNATWASTPCTCGMADHSEHFLRCAKWIAVLPNHAARNVEELS